MRCDTCKGFEPFGRAFESSSWLNKRSGRCLHHWPRRRLGALRDKIGKTLLCWAFSNWPRSAPSLRDGSSIQQRSRCLFLRDRNGNVCCSIARFRSRNRKAKRHCTSPAQFTDDTPLRRSAIRRNNTRRTLSRGKAQLWPPPILSMPCNMPIGPNRCSAKCGSAGSMQCMSLSPITRTSAKPSPISKRGIATLKLTQT